MNITFNKATICDIEKSIEIQNQSFYNDFLKYGSCPSYQRTPERMKEIIENEIVYLIFYDHILVGCVIVKRPDGNEWHISSLGIIPAYQNLGIGQQTILFLEKEFPTAKYWTLDTPADKPQNHHFYEKMGYQKVGEETYHNFRLFLYEKHIV